MKGTGNNYLILIILQVQVKFAFRCLISCSELWNILLTPSRWRTGIKEMKRS